MMKRKARCDRKHAVYTITNILTGEQYVGITVCSGNIAQALKVRMQKHAERARNENKDWPLCVSLRTYGPEAFTYGLLETVRGRKPAHSRERELIAQFQPTLNQY